MRFIALTPKVQKSNPREWHEEKQKLKRSRTTIRSHTENTLNKIHISSLETKIPADT
jgi:hypothetical protein